MIEPSQLFLNSTFSRKSEQKGRLCEEWLGALYSQKYFKLFVPEVYGGLSLELVPALKIEEKLAFIDGSLGWTTTLCAGAGWFVGFMGDQLREEVFKDPKVCFAGSGFVGGKANKIGDCYHIHGSWTHASGALHATHFTANCEILENGIPVLDSFGKSVVKAFILAASEIEILDSWRYMGMIATGSHAFKVENLKIPINRCFDILPEKAKLSDPIYRFPFLQFAEATLAVNILGITRHFQELIKESFEVRKQQSKFREDQLDYFDQIFSTEDNEIKLLRMEFYEVVQSAWNELVNHGELSDGKLKNVSQVSRRLVQTCRESNAKLFPFGGLHAAKTDTELNRVWRDFNTVSQHSLLTFPF